MDIFAHPWGFRDWVGLRVRYKLFNDPREEDIGRVVADHGGSKGASILEIESDTKMSTLCGHENRKRRILLIPAGVVEILK